MKCKRIVIIFSLLFAFLNLTALSQIQKTINLKEVPQRKIRRYISSREIDIMPDFYSINASWKKDARESDYNFTEKVFFLDYKITSVWECYRHSNTAETWNGRSSRLGLLITKCSNSVTYCSSPRFPEIDTSQVYFLNLRLLKGLFNVPVAIEIINIDPERKLVELSYIENNKSRGKQTIQFFADGDEVTRIVHRSYFKSDSFLREGIFYPLFHKKFVNEFHRTMQYLIRLNDISNEVLSP